MKLLVSLTLRLSVRQTIPLFGNICFNHTMFSPNTHVLDQTHLDASSLSVRAAR